jgi:hypothetical protein
VGTLTLANSQPLSSGTAVTLSVGNNDQSTSFTGDILGSGILIKIGGGEPGLTYFHVTTSPASVPEPGALVLLAAAALAGVAVWGRKNHRVC